MTLRVLLCLLLISSTEAFWSSPQSASEKEDKAETHGNSNGVASTETPVEYGVDISFPIHRSQASTNYAWLPHNLDPSLPVPNKYKDMPIQVLGDRQKFYEDFIDGCREAFGRKGQRCLDTERDRVEMSLRQPQSMQNYTDTGFKKIRAPEKVFNLIRDFWEKNHQNQKPEQWGTANTYTNNWASPTNMVSVEDSTLRGGGFALKQKIWDAARETISEWTGQELTQCSLYGIRIYKEGAVLSTHVDRLPLVSSAIINVAQDVDEPWPLEVYGHDGKAVNVTMEPGDMVLYESHSVLHGRPFPLKGRYMANIFIHFEPTGHSLRHNLQMDGNGDVHAKYREAIEKGHGGHENDNEGLPPYIIPGTPEDAHWRESHPSGYKDPKKGLTTGSSPIHLAAQEGRLDDIKTMLEEDKSLLNKRDSNGWSAIHEAARGGHIEVVKYLVDNGADVNAKTHNSGSVLWWAKQTHDDGDPIIEFLEGLGAMESGPEL